MMDTIAYCITHSVPRHIHPNAKDSSEWISATGAVSKANRRLCESLDSTYRLHAEMVLEEEFTPELIADWGLKIEAYELEMEDDA